MNNAESSTCAIQYRTKSGDTIQKKFASFDDADFFAFEQRCRRFGYRIISLNRQGVAKTPTEILQSENW